MSFGYGTAIQVNKDTVENIENFQVGDPVQAFDLVSNKPTNNRQVKVMFSSGVSHSKSSFIRITYDSAGESAEIICTGNQPFLMSDGATVKRADALVPGKDMLWLVGGTLTAIKSVMMGMFNKGIHSIATSTSPATSLDGHLIVANGVICGDYSVEIAEMS